MEHSPQAVEPKRQDRGKQRMESLLLVAEAVFAEVGFERATTNLIAARALVSPGTLYQFYPNKEALAETLAARYAERFQKLHEQAFQLDTVPQSLAELIDAAVDPFLEFHRGAPAFDALVQGSAFSPALANGIRFLHDTVTSRVTKFLEAQIPNTKKEDLKLAAEASVAVFRGFVPLISSQKDGQGWASQELKKVLTRYLEPLLQ